MTSEIAEILARVLYQSQGVLPTGATTYRCAIEKAGDCQIHVERADAGYPYPHVIIVARKQ